MATNLPNTQFDNALCSYTGAVFPGEYYTIVTQILSDTTSTTKLQHIGGQPTNLFVSSFQFAISESTTSSLNFISGIRILGQRKILEERFLYITREEYEEIKRNLERYRVEKGLDVTDMEF